jgi:hypothetical protein
VTFQHILYGIELYATTYLAYLDTLIKLNNKISRNLQIKPILTPVLELGLYVNYNTLTIVKLQQLLILVHKFMHHVELLPGVFVNYFTVNQTIHSYNPRAKDDIHIYRPNCNLNLVENMLQLKLVIYGTHCMVI